MKIVNSDLEDTHVNSHCHKSCFIWVLAAHLMQVVEFHNKITFQRNKLLLWNGLSLIPDTQKCLRIVHGIEKTKSLIKW